MARRTDWNALRVEFVHGSMSMRELAASHGIRPSTLMNQATRHGWEAERVRQRAEASEQAAARLAAQKVDELTKFNEGDLALAKALKVMVGRTIEQWSKSKLQASPNDMAALARTADTAQKIGRLALGATTGNTGLSAPDGGPVRTDDGSALPPPEEYEAIARKLLDEYRT